MAVIRLGIACNFSFSREPIFYALLLPPDIAFSFVPRLLFKNLSKLSAAASCNPGATWENGYIESFNGKLRDELLHREIFTTLTEAKVLIEEWRKEYNQVRPHSARNNRPPAPEAILTMTTT